MAQGQGAVESKTFARGRGTVADAPDRTAVGLYTELEDALDLQDGP